MSIPARNIVAIDIGNTNTKILINTEPLQTIHNTILIKNNVIQQFNLPQINGIAHLGICSVVSPTTSNKIVKKLTKLMGINQPKIISIQTNEVLNLATPSQSQDLQHLGCDRALKIYYLTQLNKSSNHLCFGCGTAFSIEVVANGYLVDSAITPGISLQLKTLNTKLANLPSVADQEISTILADEKFYATKHSIVYGIINSFCGLIQTLANKWQVSTITGSGGYAELVSKYLLTNYQLSSKIHINLETQIIRQILEKYH